jgi:drug/metabolite transporter (DMT)-like permease
MTTAARKYLDWTLVISCNFMWATQVSVIKLIGDRLGPVAITFLPMVLSTLIFLPALWWEARRRGTGLHWRWADARHFLIAGIFGTFLIQFTYTLGSQRTLAANAGIITLTIPVFVAFAASVMLKEKMNPVRLLSFVLALAGVLMTSVAELRDASFGRAQYLAGNLLFLVACAASAFYNTYCKLLVEKRYTELEILVYTSIVASVASVPLFVFLEPLGAATWARLDRVALLGLLELALIVYGLSMLVFFSVLKRLDVTQASLGNYLLPFFIALLALAVLKESVTPMMMAGGTIVLASTLLVTVYEGEILAWLRRRSPAAGR